MSPAHLHNGGECDSKIWIISDFQVFAPTNFFGVLAPILNFGSIFKKSLAHPHVARNVMQKCQRIMARLIPLPLRAGDKNPPSPTGEG